MKEKHLLLTLFLSMLKIGAFTFGGGYAMISLLSGEFVTKRKWIDENEFLDAPRCCFLQVNNEKTSAPDISGSGSFLIVK